MLEVLGEPTVAVQPCQCSLDDPAAREDNEALGGIGPFDDLDGPFADTSKRVSEFVTSISAIGKDMAQPREAPDNLGQHQQRAVKVLDVGGVNHCVDQIAVSVGQEWRLRPLIFLPAS